GRRPGRRATAGERPAGNRRRGRPSARDAPTPDPPGRRSRSPGTGAWRRGTARTASVIIPAPVHRAGRARPLTRRRSLRSRAHGPLRAAEPGGEGGVSAPPADLERTLAELKRPNSHKLRVGGVSLLERAKVSPAVGRLTSREAAVRRAEDRGRRRWEESP